MKTSRFFLTACALLSTSLTYSRMHEMKTAQEFNEKTKNKIVVIDFFATWCGPCKKMAPLMETLSEEYTDVLFVKIDADNQSLIPVAQQYGVTSLPTFVILDKQGQVMDKFSGFAEINVRRTRDSIAKAKNRGGGMPAGAPAGMPREMAAGGGEEFMPEPSNYKPSKMNPHKTAGTKHKKLMHVQTPAHFEKHVLGAQGPVVIHFRKMECQTCDMIGASLERLMHNPEYEGITFVTIMVENRELKSIIKGEGILILPSYEFKNMKEFKKLKTEGAIEKEIKKLLEK